MAHLIDKDALVAWAKETYLCENASMIRAEAAAYEFFLRARLNNATKDLMC